MPTEERVKVEEVELEETSEKPKKGLAIMLIIIALVAVIQCVVLFVIFKEEISTIFEKEEVEEVVEVVTLYYPLDPMSVNLADKTQRHFLKATASLEYQDAELTLVMDERKAELQATVMEVLRSKTLEEVNSVEETKLLAEEIVEALNEVFETEAFADVHFTDYLYQ